MPVAHINLLEGHSRAELRQVIVEVSEAMSNILQAPKDRLIVWISEHKPHLWGLGGVPADEALANGSLAELELPFVQAHALIETVSEILARVLDCDKQKIRIHIAPADPDRWGIGGVPASALRAAEIAARAEAGKGAA